MKELVQSIAEALVSKPAAVQVKETTNGSVHLLELFVAKEDTGRIIGKDGHTIEAIRTLISSVAGKTGEKVTFAFDGYMRSPRKKE